MSPTKAKPSKSKPAGKKIGIFGLDNAGKSTIIEVLEDQKDLQSLATLQPTVRVKIHDLLDLAPDWVMWDFGGQVAYRKEYLAMPQRYFFDLALIIFVIDVQDPSRFDVAVQYLDDCMKNANTNSPNYEILVLLHKADPDILNTPTMQQNLQHLQGMVTKILSQNKRAEQVFISTIFDANLQLTDARFGKLNQPTTLASLTQEAKKVHAQLKPSSPSTPAITTPAVGAGASVQNTTGNKTLQQLSLERKRILEEFRRLIKN